jgi:hypothetical protein
MWVATLGTLCLFSWFVVGGRGICDMNYEVCFGPH